MPRPTTVFAWATDPGTRLASFPSAPRQATGWLPNEPNPALSTNALLGNLFDWATYLSELSPATNTIGPNPGQLTVADDLFVTGTTIMNDLATAYNGMVVAENNTTDYYYAYRATSLPDFRYYASPVNGAAWFLMKLSGSTDYTTVLGAPSYVYPTTIAPDVLTLRYQIVFPEDVVNNPTTHPWVIEAIEFRGWKNAAGDLVELRLMRQQHGSNAEQVRATATLGATGAWTPVSATPTEQILADYQYFLDVKLRSTTTNTDARLSEVSYTLTKTAVE